MMARDSDEVLSFGTFTSAGGPFEPHASLAAKSNGTLAVKAAGLDLLPGGGAASFGSGGQETATKLWEKPTCTQLRLHATEACQALLETLQLEVPPRLEYVWNVYVPH